jgi:hypothetical protein
MPILTTALSRQSRLGGADLGPESGSRRSPHVADHWRMLVPDRKGYAPDVNRYRYCHNNPVNSLDPSGLDDQWAYDWKLLEKEFTKFKDVDPRKQQNYPDVKAWDVNVNIAAFGCLRDLRELGGGLVKTDNGTGSVYVTRKTVGTSTYKTAGRSDAETVDLSRERAVIEIWPSHTSARTPLRCTLFSSCGSSRLPR